MLISESKCSINLMRNWNLATRHLAFDTEDQIQRKTTARPRQDFWIGSQSSFFHKKLYLTVEHGERIILQISPPVQTIFVWKPVMIFCETSARVRTGTREHAHQCHFIRNQVATYDCGRMFAELFFLFSPRPLWTFRFITRTRHLFKCEPHC